VACQDYRSGRMPMSVRLRNLHELAS
jgi:hypothetical protein